MPVRSLVLLCADAYVNKVLPRAFKDGRKIEKKCDMLGQTRMEIKNPMCRLEVENDILGLIGDEYTVYENKIPEVFQLWYHHPRNNWKDG